MFGIGDSLFEYGTFYTLEPGKGEGERKERGVGIRSKSCGNGRY